MPTLFVILVVCALAASVFGVLALRAETQADQASEGTSTSSEDMADVEESSPGIVVKSDNVVRLEAIKRQRVAARREEARGRTHRRPSRIAGGERQVP